MHANDVGRVIAVAIALFGVYGALQAWERRESLRNSVSLVIAGVSLFSAIEKLG